MRENHVAFALAKLALRLVKRKFGSRLVIRAKGSPGDIVTSLDLAVDRLVTGALARSFPRDTILAEESSPDATLGKGRAWVCDPICGTKNLSRGMPIIVTNIALVDSGRVVGAWVADHLRGRIISSTGNGIAIDGRRVRHTASSDDARAACVDIDWGYRGELSASVRRRYAALIGEVALEKTLLKYALLSSIAFAYVATGQLDGSVTINVRPWDVLAGAFLVKQSGGIVTNFNGSAWSIHSKSLVMAHDRRTHRRLLALVKKHGLQHVK